MTKNQFRAILKRDNLTQALTAKLLGVSLRSVQDYAIGRTEVPETVARLLLLIVGELTVEELLENLSKS
jgi:transcriptional regulator with XRE-family HTH domain